jgi:DNA-binding CsgD family transcriptional regulator
MKGVSKMITCTSKQLAEILGISADYVEEIFETCNKTDKIKGKRNKYDLIKCVKNYVGNIKGNTLTDITGKTLSDVIGISERTVRNLTEKGILVKNDNDKYNLHNNVQRYINDKDEWNKLKKVQRETAEEKLAILQNRYHADEDIEFILTEMLAKFKGTLEAAVNKIDNSMDIVTSENRKEMIQKHIMNALLEMAEYNPPSNNMKE